MTSTPTVRWGIVATGAIASTMAAQLRLVEGAELLAVASRSPGRAQTFAAEHHVPRAYGTHDELLADPDVDIVYIATPHAHHHQVAVKALNAGKHLLVEKSFTCRVESTEDIVQRAREKNLFVMEAMKTRFLPLARRMRELVADGAIGEVRAVRADLGFAKPFDPSSRLWDLDAGGGAMLDVGVYCVSLAHMMLGAPESVQAVGRMAPNGVDASVGLQLGYADGRYAQLACSLETPVDRSAWVLGTEGTLRVSAPFHHFSELTLTRSGPEAAPEVFADDTRNSMVAELAEVTRLIQQGRRESGVMPLDETVSVMRTMDIALDQIGAERPHEGFLG